ncbi:hypothetical protein [Streptomyces beihaiensis]|uniref:Uncharacterized protein n=1 Tax=Streptomyces beihaiensis TaxID=2984495 RepID=A0ABT3U2L9_9ACTN|nr:hypothetical protein [Streptomyces beihaiensis]MCX3063557.1 hypothetical protein [Streptomyces beihaiensis]
MHGATSAASRPTRHDSAPHTPGVFEHVPIAAGRALVGPSDGAVELGPDYV